MSNSRASRGAQDDAQQQLQHAVSLQSVEDDRLGHEMRVVWELEPGRSLRPPLFSGIGGFELGLERAGIATDLLCEFWEPASMTLAKHFDAEIAGDIRDLSSLPSVDVVAAGFPCTI